MKLKLTLAVAVFCGVLLVMGQAVTQMNTVKVPLAGEPPAVGTNNASLLVSGINALSTNRFSLSVLDSSVASVSSNLTFYGVDTFTNNVYFLSLVTHSNNVNMAGNTITNMANGVSAKDAVTVSQLQGATNVVWPYTQLPIGTATNVTTTLSGTTITQPSPGTYQLSASGPAFAYLPNSQTFTGTNGFTAPLLLVNGNSNQLTSAATTALRTFTLPDANSNPVQPSSAAANQFATGISSAGVISYAQPSFSNLSGTATFAQLPIQVGTNFVGAGGLSTSFSGGVWTLTQGAANDALALYTNGTRAMQASLNMGNNTITNMANGTTSSSAVTLSQLQGATNVVWPASQLPSNVAYTNQDNNWVTQTFKNAINQTNASSTNAFYGPIAVVNTYSNAIVSATLTGNRTFTLPDANSNPVQPSTAGAHQFATGISSAGVITWTQPAFSDISGTAAYSQLPTGTLTNAVMISGGQTNLIASVSSGLLTLKGFSPGSNITISDNGTNLTITSTGGADSQALYTNGTRAMQASLNMGNNTITNMANGVNAKDAVTVSQLQGATNVVWPATQLPSNTAYTNQDNNFSVTETFASAINQTNSNSTNNFKGVIGIVASGGTNFLTSSTLTGLRTFTLPDANSNPVQPSSAAANQFATGISSAGVISYAQPSFSNLSGTASATQLQLALLTNGTVSMAASLNMGNNTITNMANGTTSSSAVTLSQLQGATNVVWPASQLPSNVAYTNQDNNFSTKETFANYLQETNSSVTNYFSSPLSFVSTNSFTNVVVWVSTPTANRTFTLPDANSNPVQPSTAGAHQFATGISSAGVITWTQPAFSDISGTAAYSQLPTGTLTNAVMISGGQTNLIASVSSGLLTLKGFSPGSNITISDNGTNLTLASTAGGGNVNNNQNNTFTTASTNWMNSPLYFIVGNGTNQVTSVSLTGNRTFTLPDANSNPVQPSTAGAHQFATGISSAGVITWTQPAFSDISGSATLAQLPVQVGTNFIGAGGLSTSFSGGTWTLTQGAGSGITSSVISSNLTSYPMTSTYYQWQDIATLTTTTTNGTVEVDGEAIFVTTGGYEAINVHSSDGKYSYINLTTTTGTNGVIFGQTPVLHDTLSGTSKTYTLSVAASQLNILLTNYWAAGNFIITNNLGMTVHQFPRP